MKTYTINCKRGIDDLMCEYAFTGNSQGDHSHSNEISDYIASKGWMSFNFIGIDVTDQQAIYAEVERRKAVNQKYIELLKKKGTFGESYEVKLTMNHNPVFDEPEISNFPLESYKLVFLDAKDLKL